MTPAPTSRLRLIAPLRVLDTRPGAGPIGFREDGLPIVAGPIHANETRRYKVSGRTFFYGTGGTGPSFTFPAEVTAIYANVTIQSDFGGIGGGYVTLFPGDVASAPNASTVNPSTFINFNFTAVGFDAAGNASAPAGTVALGGRAARANSGTFAVFSTNQLHVIVDVVGYYSPSNPPTLGTLQFVTPVRVLDTRATDGGPIGFDGATGNAIAAAPINANETRRYRVGGMTFNVGSTGGDTVAFPNDVTGLIANVTIVQPSGPSGGYVTVFPGNVATAPNASTVNPSTTIAFNGWAVEIPTTGADAGNFQVFSTNELDVIVDVVGYWAPSNASTLSDAAFVTPVRVLDTRATDGGPIGFDCTSGQAISAGPIPADGTRCYQVAGETFNLGLGGGGTYVFPSQVRGLLANVTIVSNFGGIGGGYVTVFPGDVGNAPNASTVNPSTVIAENFWATGIPVPPGANPGAFKVFTTNQLHVVVDALGYFP